MVLGRFMAYWQDKNSKGDKIDAGEIGKIVDIFEEQFDP